MDSNEIKKAQAQNIADIIDYVPNSVVSKNIISKTTGSISIIAVDTGVKLARKIIPFDVFIEIVEGSAEIVIEDKSIILKSNQGIVIPAHVQNRIIVRKRFKMLETIIKSGY